MWSFHTGLLFSLLFAIVLAADSLPFNAGYYGYGDRPVDKTHLKAVYDEDTGDFNDSSLIPKTIETATQNELNADISAYQGAQQQTIAAQTQITTEAVIEITPTSSRLDRGPATFPSVPSDGQDIATKPPPVRSVQLVPGTIKYTTVEQKPTVQPPPTLNPTTYNSAPALPTYSSNIPLYQAGSPSFSSDSSILPPLPTALPPIFTPPGSPLTSYSYYTLPVRSSGIHSRLIYIPGDGAPASLGAIYDPTSLLGNSQIGLSGQLGANLQTLNGVPSVWGNNDILRSSYLSGKYPRRRKKTVESEVGNER